MTANTPRTAAGRDFVQSLADYEGAYIFGHDYEVEVDSVRSAVCRIEAEAAAPTPAEPLDVERLRKVLEHFDVVDYHYDLHGVTMKDPATPIAAEYNRLAAARPEADHD